MVCLNREEGSRPAEKNSPQQRLWEALRANLPDHLEQPCWEHPVRIPGRRQPYRIDIAFPQAKLAVEVDGWEYHGKYKSGFQRDRERERRLQLHEGWRFQRFYAGEILRNPEALVAEITLLLTRLHDGFGGEHAC